MTATSDQLPVTALLVCTLALGACDRLQHQQGAPAARAEPAHEPAPEGAAELQWAKAALARNPNIELLATDEQSRVFTVRDRGSGDVLAVKLDELAAAPIAQLQDPRSTAALASSQNAAAAERTPEQVETPAPIADATAERSSEQPSGSSGTANYTIERADGQVRVSGPGVSIVSSRTPAASGAAPGDTQRTVEPIICEGARMLHFDNREIFVEGDAITVRGGCEMHITNSRIVATGTAVVVQDGIVHVSNSHIEGGENSFAADERARLFVRGSTFQGLPRRAETAMIQDQGGNRWR